jgi:hypothetical protein
VDPRVGLDTEDRGKILCPRRESNPDRPARSQALYSLSYPASNLRYYSGIVLERLSKHRQNSQSLGRDLIPGPPEYEV